MLVGGRDLADQDGEGHVQDGVDGTGRGVGVVGEGFHHECGVVADDDSGLLHAQQARLPLGVAEGARGVHGHIRVIPGGVTALNEIPVDLGNAVRDGAEEGANADRWPGGAPRNAATPS